MEKNEKKRLVLFLAVAYGLTLIMSIFMFMCFKADKDMTAFVNVQMTYPACGVILGLLIWGNKERKLPKAGFIVFLVTAALMMVVAIASTFMAHQMSEINGGQISNWNLYSQYVLMAGSTIAYILFWVCGKEKRRNAGLSRTKVKLSIVMVVLFVVLYIARMYVSGFLTQTFIAPDMNVVAEINGLLTNPSVLSSAVIVLVNFPLMFIAFLGEEYGWRYYLQPILQKKFGLRLGVIILGVAWGTWHGVLDFIFYSTTTGLQYFTAQIITCIALAIFMGYAYMKTGNIWAIAMMHFINNNYIAVFAGGDATVIQNQTITWAQIPIAVVQSLVFALFILAPIYKNKKEEEVLEAKAS
ncbi:CPBP family intramembrane glutamic endopeptidase [Butyrivibrio sp. WCD3002]|uniref:CPBP family intramembrane glutamic endopeptidase n=1 Tax=Butyrivibrio sp. WCD3002 TaxID=1280676 RepID=UPI0004123C74|nr:CPBP family intramembrane glutamic endopeptidase [Butyrivibrio sp. WCD3002]